MHDEVLFIQVVDRKIVIRTETAFITGSLTKQLDYILKQYGFAKADSNTIVNVKKIINKDKKNSVVYFEEDMKLGCIVSRRNRKKFFI